jgi:hypothetical protein
MPDGHALEPLSAFFREPHAYNHGADLSLRVFPFAQCKDCNYCSKKSNLRLFGKVRLRPNIDQLLTAFSR